MESLHQLHQLSRTLYRKYKPLSTIPNCTSPTGLSNDQQVELTQAISAFSSKVSGGGTSNIIANLEKSIGLNAEPVPEQRISSTVKRNQMNQEKEAAKLLTDLQTFQASLSDTTPPQQSQRRSVSSKKVASAKSISTSTDSICTLVKAYFQKKLDIVILCMKLLPTKSTANSNPCILLIQKGRLKPSSAIGKAYIKAVKTCIRILTYLQSTPFIKIKNLDYFTSRLNDLFKVLYQGCQS